MSFPGDSGSGYTLVTLDRTTNQPCADVWEAQDYASKGACESDPQNPKTGSVVEFIRSLAEDPNPAASKPSTSFASGVLCLKLAVVNRRAAVHLGDGAGQ